MYPGKESGGKEDVDFSPELTLKTQVVYEAQREFLMQLVALNGPVQNSEPLALTVDRLISSGVVRNIVVIGSPGTGKTTLTQALVRMWTRDARNSGHELDVQFTLYDVVHKYLTHLNGDDSTWSEEQWMMISQIFDEWSEAKERPRSSGDTISYLHIEEFPRISGTELRKDRGAKHLRNKIKHFAAITNNQEKLIIFVVVAPQALRESNKIRRHNILSNIRSLEERLRQGTAQPSSIKILLDGVMEQNGLNLDYDAVYQSAFKPRKVILDRSDVAEKVLDSESTAEQKIKILGLLTLMIDIFGSMASTEFIDSIWLESVLEARFGLDEINRQLQINAQVRNIFSKNGYRSVQDVLNEVLARMNKAMGFKSVSNVNLEEAQVMTYHFLSLLIEGQPRDQIVLAFNTAYNHPIISQIVSVFKASYDKS